jgi:hypothetical protein
VERGRVDKNAMPTPIHPVTPPCLPMKQCKYLYDMQPMRVNTEFYDKSHACMGFTYRELRGSPQVGVNRMLAGSRVRTLA